MEYRTSSTETFRVQKLNSREYWQTFVIFAKQENNAKFLSRLMVTPSADEKQAFLDFFGDFADKIHIEHIMSCWPEFELQGVEANKEKGIYGQEIREVDACPYPFYSFSINSDGKVSLCFLDWGRKLVVGDVNNSSLSEIWNSREMRSYRKMFLEGRRKYSPVCGSCGQMTHGMPDDIDPYKKSLLEKLSQQVIRRCRVIFRVWLGLNVNILIALCHG